MVMRRTFCLLLITSPSLAFAGTSNDVEGQFLYTIVGLLLIAVIVYKPTVRFLNLIWTRGVKLFYKGLHATKSRLDRSKDQILPEIL